MLRILIFSAACLIVFVGLVTTMPILEEGVDISQFASVSAYPEEQVSKTPSCIISANPQVISEGETTSIAWASQNASEAELYSVGAVPLEGGMFFKPVYSDVYTLTVRSLFGEVISCSTYVTVL